MKNELITDLASECLGYVTETPFGINYLTTDAPSSTEAIEIAHEHGFAVDQVNLLKGDEFDCELTFRRAENTRLLHAPWVSDDE